MNRLIFSLCLLLYTSLTFGQHVLIRGEVISFDQPFAEANGEEAPFFRYAHFEKIPTIEERQRIEKLGVQFLQYFSERTYLIALQQNVQINNIIGLDGLIEIPAKSKMSKRLKERPIPIWAQAGKGQVKLSIQSYGRIPNSTFLHWLEKQEVKIDFVGKHRAYAEITTDESNIKNLAAKREVAFLDWILAPAYPEDVVGQGVHRSAMLDASYAGGRNYDGTGVSVLVRDDGAIGPHIDFEGRLDQDDFDIASGYDHGDMVSGILCGAGNINSNYRGMVPGAFLYVRPYNSNFLTYTLDLHLNKNVAVSSTSYGTKCNEGYTVDAYNVDEQLYANPNLMHFFSAGNRGTSDCNYGVKGWGNITGGHKQGKNCIAVGNLNADVALENSSSRGPAYDGRIKPDLCAFGQGQITTKSFNRYRIGGGTSAASPGAAGVYAQLVSAYRTINGGAEPEAALLKACLLNTAIDLGHEGPDFKYGWGEINGFRAVQVLEDHHYLAANISQGQIRFHNINVPAGQTQVRFMLYWADPPASPDAATALINNLDIKVIAPDESTTYPWVLNPSAVPFKLDDPAVRGVDNLNNAEQVTFQTPLPGNYQIVVTGTSIPMGQQAYYIVHSPVQEPLVMAFPVGGERFEPAETVRVFWDSYDNSNTKFILEKSFDNGMSWSLAGETFNNSYVWKVPNISTKEGLFRVSRDGASAQMISTFSIFNRPDSIWVDTVCVATARLSWNAVPNAISYDVFTLGEKYMEPVGNSLDTTLVLPLADPLDSFWYAVQANGTAGVVSPRSMAYFYAGGLSNCTVGYDLEITSLIDLENEFGICESISKPIRIQVVNNGTEELTGVKFLYKFNANTYSEYVYGGVFAPGSTSVIEIADPMVFDATGTYNLSVKISSSLDEIESNNSFDLTYQVINYQTSSLPSLEEQFESINYEADWSIAGNKGAYNWIYKESVIGINGQESSVVWVDNFNSDQVGKKLILSSEAIAVPEDSRLFLAFDYAYSPFDNTFSDTMMIRISDPCDDSKAVKTVFYKGGEVLKTINSNAQDTWTPTASEDWAHVVIPVAGFDDGLAKVDFININGYGNSLFLDNINFYSGRINSMEAACMGESFSVTTNLNTIGNTYFWDFDNGIGSVSGGAVASVIYNTTGTKHIQLIVGNGSHQDTLYKTVEVKKKPEANFNFTINDDGSVTFDNTSNYLGTTKWDFGDGSTSDEFAPLHQFGNGKYEACLYVDNNCGKDTLCQEVNVTTSIKDIADVFEGILLAPNPTSDILFLKNIGHSDYVFDVAIVDITGRVLKTNSGMILGVGMDVVFDVSTYSSGVYWVRLMDRDKVAYAKIIVE